MSNRDLVSFAIFVFYRLAMIAMAIICVMNGLWFMAVVCVLLAFTSSYHHNGGNDATR